MIYPNEDTLLEDGNAGVLLPTDTRRPLTTTRPRPGMPPPPPVAQTRPATPARRRMRGDVLILPARRVSVSHDRTQNPRQAPPVELLAMPNILGLEPNPGRQSWEKSLGEFLAIVVSARLHQVFVDLAGQRITYADFFYYCRCRATPESCLSCISLRSFPNPIGDTQRHSGETSL